jgi:hypothetical protein
MQSADNIILQQAFFEGISYTPSFFYDDWAEGPHEFTCDVLRRYNNSTGPIGPRIKDNYLGNVPVGVLSNVQFVNIYTTPPSYEPFIIGAWPAGETVVFVKYWEDDPIFDLFVGEHNVIKQSNGVYEHISFNPKARYVW